ncbi:MAG: nucleoside phosphorylase [Clostridia bacterium]|nr:nucleoside phosphorylase [Clostridia bacterium]
MITSSFDENKIAVINPVRKDELVKCDVIIVTFSNQIEEFVVEKFKPTMVGKFSCVNGVYSIYVFEWNGKRYGFYKTLIGAAASVGMMEDVVCMFDCEKILVFGSAGTLDKSCHGKVMIPTDAYRDEGTSYHYEKAADYIKIKNANIVENFMKRSNISYKCGKCWTIDAFYRETERNLKDRQNDGCIAVGMECAAIQAMCNFRDLDLYYFFLSGDLLDSPEWVEDGLKEANHSFQNFEIALRLASEL